VSAIPAKEAVELIKSGRAPVGLTTGVLDLSFAKVKQHVTLPAGLSCFSLNLSGQPVESLSVDVRVEFKLDLSNCIHLRSLPANLSVTTLVLTNCTGLHALPEHLQVGFLQLDGCTALREWPESVHVRNGWVRARNCVALRHLPSKLGPVASLDLRGCQGITNIPPGAVVNSWIDIGGTRITSLPETLQGVALRWRGVAVSAQIAFFSGDTYRGANTCGAER